MMYLTNFLPACMPVWPACLAAPLGSIADDLQAQLRNIAWDISQGHSSGDRGQDGAAAAS